MNRVLVAGATGYLGSYIAKELKKQDYYTKVVVRNLDKFKKLQIQVDEVFQAEVTDYSTLKNCCKNIDVVISTIGLTKNKDGLSYMDVDYQANLNLLKEAQNDGVKKFIYISVLNADKLKHISICKVKEMFGDELKKSGLDYCIIRPNGFFSDMTEFYNLAKRGKVYLFGNGEYKTNPIHGKDLAKVCINAIQHNKKEIDVGGPEIFTQNEIAKIAFDILGQPYKITYIPDWVRRLILKLSRIFMKANKYGPIEFFINVMAMDMIAPKYGKHTLKKHFQKL